MVDLGKNKRSLLLYCETCAVDHEGRMDARHINGEDLETLAQWNVLGYVRHGRIAFQYIGSGARSMWCYLSDQAWTDVQLLRWRRAERVWKGRKWQTTAELRGEDWDEG